MYCSNCGNKIDENAYVCVNCGVIIKKTTPSKISTKSVSKTNSSITGIVSILLASVSLVFGLYGFIFGDITSVGMYTSIVERLTFAMNYNLIQFLFAIIGLVFSLVEINKKSNKIGLFLVLLAFFFILSEFVVILIY